MLALLFNEPGGQRVLSVLENGQLSTVNLAEVHARLLKRGASSDSAWNQISALQCEICDFTEQQARIAAELSTVTQPYGLSLGDRACLALGIERKATIYTTDRMWKHLALGIEIEVIR